MPLQTVNEKQYPELFNSKVCCHILSMIHTGRLQGVHLRELTRATGLPERSIRKVIEDIRRAGIVICTDCLHGYYYPETVAELSAYIRQEERRGNSTLYTLSTAKSLYSELQEA